MKKGLGIESEYLIYIKTHLYIDKQNLFTT